MKNILYIGPYKENNGLGRSSRRYIRSLITDNNINLSIRPIYFTSLVDNTNKEFAQFEENYADKYDCVIQHGYPDMFQYNRKFGKNIGIVEIETENLIHTGWIEKINIMDEIVVGSKLGREAMNNSGVNIPIKLLPEPYNIDSYSLQKPEDFFDQDNSDFIFYTIGTYNEKNNIKGIILAYLLEFDFEENVRLVIKTNKYTISTQILEQQITEDIHQIQNAIKKRPSSCPQINILAGEITDHDISRLHQNANCYVNTTRSDGNGASSIEATLKNNPVITTDHIAASDFINQDNGYIVSSLRSNIYYPDPIESRSYSIWGFWYEPSIISIRNKMREAYSNSKIIDYKFDKTPFSHKVIGPLLHE